jgi:GTPase SAR1 family protein
MEECITITLANETEREITIVFGPSSSNFETLLLTPGWSQNLTLKKGKLGIVTRMTREPDGKDVFTVDRYKIPEGGFPVVLKAEGNNTVVYRVVDGQEEVLPLEKSVEYKANTRLQSAVDASRVFANVSRGLNALNALNAMNDGMLDLSLDDERQESVGRQPPEKPFVREIIQSLKKVTTSETGSFTSTEVMNAAQNLKRLCAQPEFKREFISQVKADCPDIVKEIPDFEKALDGLGTIPLDRFSNPKEVLTFVNALIDSGSAAQVDRGLIFVLGNTKAGKTSLVNTFKSFVESPSKDLTPVLTEKGDNLFETQVLEVYDDLLLKQEKTLKVELSRISSAPTLVKFKEEPVAATNNSGNEGLQLKIVDIGGHKEYFSASALFVASSGLFLVCFDSNLEPEYYSQVGTYLDLIDQTVDVAGIKPKIMLVATKVENSDQCQESLDKILSYAKEHLNNLSSNSFLVDRVLETSSQIASKEIFQEMYDKVYTLCTEDELRSKPKEAIPTVWFRLLAALKEMSHTTVDAVIKMLEQIEAEKTGPENIHKEELESLKKLREVVLLLSKINDSKTATTDESEMSNGAKSQPKAPQDSETSKPKLSAEVNIDPETGESSAPGDNEEPIGPIRAALLDEARKKREKIIIVLEYLKGLGELLFYPNANNLDLCEVVITRPMDLVCSLRTVISHNPVDAFKSARFQEQKLNLLRKGLLSFNDFRTIYNSGPEQAFSEEQLWNFLLQLELGCSIGESEMEKQILVPSLIDDSMEDEFKKTGMELEGHEACVSIQYNFDKTGETFAMFMKFLKIFAEEMLLGNKGGEILTSYSQKVEERKLGNVTGVRGVMKWHTDIANIREPEEFEFLLTEYEINLPSPQKNSEFYAIHRGIRISLRPKNGSVCDAMVEILSKLDSKFTRTMENVQRCLPCKQCILDGKYGYFLLEEGMRLPSANSRCSQNLQHTMEETLIEIMQRAEQPEPFQLEPLMDRKKEDLGLEIFQTSDLRTRMLSGELKIGEQIWVYHDAEINPNTIAERMAYSHVMIYVGPRHDKDGNAIHEVVHAEWAGVHFGGAVVDRISRVNVTSVIKPNDMVFLGHKLKECQFSANAREMIAKRAIACTEPEIVFDYDYRTNCETFCNMIVFGKAESTQAKGTAKSIKRAFKSLNLLRTKTRKCLGKQIQERLEERRLV